jgi:DNA-binding transcriptional LysR family regulator
MSNIMEDFNQYYIDMDHDIELRHLRYFVAVAEELHFGRAAERLGIAQPPLSQQIQRLEALIDAPLFYRTSRSVELTDAGRTLLDGARRTLAQAEEAVTATQRTARGETGTLTVAYAASVMFLSLPRLIHAFRARYPSVHLELRELPTGPQIAALHAGEIDIGFVRQPGREKGLTIETVMTEPLLIALHRHHPLADDAVVPLAALARDSFVLFPKDIAPGLYAQVFAVCKEAGFTPRVTQESRELYTTVSLVEAGLGVSIVPASVRKMGWPDVVYKTIASPLAESKIGMAWRADDRRTVTHAFREITEATMAAL